MTVGCAAGQGAKRNGADLERELEVAVKALAVTLLAAWGLLIGLAAMHALLQGCKLCCMCVCCMLHAGIAFRFLCKIPHPRSNVCWCEALVYADLSRRERLTLRACRAN